MKLLYILSSIVFLGALSGCYAGEQKEELKEQVSGALTGATTGASARAFIDAALIVAVSAGDYPEVERLLQLGGFSEEILEIAFEEAMRVNRIDIVRLLIQAGALRNVSVDTQPRLVRSYGVQGI